MANLGTPGRARYTMKSVIFASEELGSFMKFGKRSAAAVKLPRFLHLLLQWIVQREVNDAAIRVVNFLL